jgi:hypothetical protein
MFSVRKMYEHKECTIRRAKLDWQQILFHSFVSQETELALFSDSTAATVQGGIPEKWNHISSYVVRDSTRQ